MGVFTLNVPKMEMSFEVDGRRHVLRGITDGGLHSIRGLDSKRKKKVIQEKPEMILNSLFKVEDACHMIIHSMAWMMIALLIPILR